MNLLMFTIVWIGCYGLAVLIYELSERRLRQ